MPISNLQLGLIIAGVLLVIGVMIYNGWQERRIRRRIESAFRPTDEAQAARVEPTLRAADDETGAAVPARRTAAAQGASASHPAERAESTFEPPMDVIEHVIDDVSPAEALTATSHASPLVDPDAQYSGVQPDPDIESILTLEPSAPIAVGAIAAGF